MTGEAPDIREQEDCPSPDACNSSCDQHMDGTERLLRAIFGKGPKS